MSRWIILSVVVVVLTAAAMLALYLAPSITSRDQGHAVAPKQRFVPKLKVAGDTTFDFGELPQKQRGTRSWTVRNLGNAELELRMIPTAFSFNLPKLNARSKSGEHLHVKPGESTTIDLDWNTKEIVGRYIQEVRIGTNDPGRTTFSLTVKGKVRPPNLGDPRL